MISEKTMSDYFDDLLNGAEAPQEEKKIKTDKKDQEPQTSAETGKKETPQSVPAKKIEKTRESKGDDTAKKTASRRTAFALAAVIVLIPATVLISYFAGDSKYYIASVIIMFLAMLPFFVNYENRTPQARELVTLAVMTAIAIAARLIFMWLPFFTPMAGFIVMTAVGFGAQAGFMSGALAIIVSNIVFGQGPWTPWQMFCYALIGLIAGLLAKRGMISAEKPLRSAIFTFIITFVLSGLILDTCTVFLSMNYMYEGTVLAVYAAGVPVNAANAGGSAAAVLLLIKPIMEKVDRIKTKYGL